MGLFDWFTGGTPSPPPPAPTLGPSPVPETHSPVEPAKVNETTCVTCSDPEEEKKKRKKYATREEAAAAAIKDYNPKSVAENREYGGQIMRNEDGTYSVGEVYRGDNDSLTPPAAQESTAASWHTHGAPDPRYDSENFSPADMTYGKWTAQPSYLGTPSGAIKVFDPSGVNPDLSTGTVTTLPQTAPP